MTKNELILYLKEYGILNKNGMRKSCWKKLFNNEIQALFNIYAKNYRTFEEAWFCLSNNVEPHKCEICGKLAKFTGSTKSKIKGYNTVCENCSANAVKNKIKIAQDTYNKKSLIEQKAIVNKRKQTNLKRYGDLNYGLYGSESFKKLMIERYNDPFYNNHEKTVKTCLEKYGVECNFMINGFVENAINVKRNKYGNASNYEKTKQTNLKRYGAEHPGQIKSIQNKIIKTKQLNVDEIEHKYNCIQQKKLFKKYGQGWKILDLVKLKINGRTFISNNDIPIIEHYFNEGHHTNKYVSKKEKDLFEYIKSIYKGPVLENVTNKVENNNYKFYELDIYLPELHLAFDFNGMYWHSNKFKDKYYHQRKMLNCYNQNIQLINIYEYDWDNDKTIKEKILNVIQDINNGEKYGWIPLSKLNEYKLSEPILIVNSGYKVYNEGKFIKLTI